MIQQGDLFGAQSNHLATDHMPTQPAPISQNCSVDTLASRAGVLHLLNNWQELGWLRALDTALVKLLAQLDPDAEPLVLLAIALTSHQLGHGHICLDLQTLLHEPDLTLLLPPEGQVAEHSNDLPSQRLAGIRLTDWRASLKRSRLVRSQVDVDADMAVTPLVLLDGRLYLQRYWHYEHSVAQQLVRRIQSTLPIPDDFSTRLNSLFDTPLVVAGEQQTDWQKVACAMAAQGRLTLITGGPGTGKTTTVVRLLALLQQEALAYSQALRIQLAAPTGKAATRLTESIGQQIASLPVSDSVKDSIHSEVSTLHRLLGSLPNTRHFRHNRNNPLVLDVLVIDEASMIDLEMMYNVLQALPSHARLILLGDKDQLASVEAGSVLGDLCADAQLGYYSPETQQQLEHLCQDTLRAELWCVGSAAQQPLAQRTVMLRHSRRFDADSDIGQLARAVNKSDQQLALQLLKNSSNDINYVSLQHDAAGAFDRLLLSGSTTPKSDSDALGYGYYLQVLHETRPAAQQTLHDPCWQQWAHQVLQAFDQFRLLSALRKGEFGVEGLNERIVHLLYAKQWISDTQGWYEGRPVLVTQNDYGLGLMNGDIGITLRLPSDAAHSDTEQALRVAFPRNDGQGGVRFVLPSRLTAVETVFAMTVHKSQGSEFTHTALILPDRLNPVLSKELLYTGITRARNKFTLIESHPGIFAASVRRKVERVSGLQQAILTAMRDESLALKAPWIRA